MTYALLEFGCAVEMAVAAEIEASMKTVLFVCSGNTCRSPMAEAVARQWLDQLPADDREDVFVASAGVWAADGAPPTQETVEALRRLDIAFDGHSKTLTTAMIRKADVVLTMTESHLEAVHEMLDGEGGGTTIARLDPEGDVADPIGQGQSEYNDLAKRFQTLVPLRLKETLFNEDRAGIRSSR